MSYALQKVEDGLAVKASMTFQVAGDYAAIRRFIYRMETAGYYLVIESLDATRSGGARQARGGQIAVSKVRGRQGLRQ